MFSKRWILKHSLTLGTHIFGRPDVLYASRKNNWKTWSVRILLLVAVIYFIDFSYCSNCTMEYLIFRVSVAVLRG